MIFHVNITSAAVTGLPLDHRYLLPKVTVYTWSLSLGTILVASVPLVVHLIGLVDVYQRLIEHGFHLGV